MARVQTGDASAFAELMHRWESPVKGLLARLVFNAREAEDLAQETFVRVWQQRARYRIDAPFRPWLFAIAVNLARNRLRWWRRRPEVALSEWDQEPASSPGGAAALVRQERAGAVRAAIAELPLALREPLVLFEYEDLSHAEIAAALQLTAKAVENRLYRARERLRDRLRAWR